MKRLFKIIICILFSSVFFSHAYAEERVSRELVDSIVARTVSVHMLPDRQEYNEFVNRHKDAGDKLVREYICFRQTSDRAYDWMKDLPRSELENCIRFTNSYVYYRLHSPEFWDTFKEYIQEAKKDNKFDFSIRDVGYARLAECIDEEYSPLIEHLLNSPGAWRLRNLSDRPQFFLVKTLMAYFPYEEFVESHPECIGITRRIIIDSFVLNMFSLKGVSGQMCDSLLNDRSELKRLAEYMKITRQSMCVFRGLYRPMKEVKLKEGEYWGETYDGVPDGEGVLIDKKGMTYHGTFRNGARHGVISVSHPKKGHVMQYWYNGKLMKGVPLGPEHVGFQEMAVIDGKRFGYGCDTDSRATHKGYFFESKLKSGEARCSEYMEHGYFRKDNRVDRYEKIWTENSKYKKHLFAGSKLGHWTKGVMHMVYAKDGAVKVYVGHFIDDIPEGEVRSYWHLDRDTIWRDGLYAYGKQYGYGQIRCSRVDKKEMAEKYQYDGSIINNRPHGKGVLEVVLTNFPGEKFGFNAFGVKLTNESVAGMDTVTVRVEGYFEKGSLVEGKIVASNGTYKSGYFKDGVLSEGRMIKKYSDGSYYDGECRDGKYNGYGKIIYHDGSVYEGGFVDGFPVSMEFDYIMSASDLANMGKCTKTFVFDNLTAKKGVASLVKAAGVKIMVRDRSSVEVTCHGKFKDDIMYAGKVTVSDGTWLEGSFEDGILIKGKARTIDKYGTVYTGEIKNGFPHGKGECLYKNGTMFKGNFANGNRMDGVHYASDGKVIKVYEN